MSTSLFHGVQTLKRRVGLPAPCDIRFVSTETGTPLNRRKDVDAAPLEAFLEGFDPRMRVARFNAEVARVFGAQVNARAELLFAGRPVSGRLSVSSLLEAPRPHAGAAANASAASSTRRSTDTMETASAAS